MSETAQELIEAIKDYHADENAEELARRVEAVLALPMSIDPRPECEDTWNDALRLVWDILNGEKP